MGCGANRQASNGKALLLEAERANIALRVDVQHQREESERLRSEHALSCKERDVTRRGLEEAWNECDKIRQERDEAQEELMAFRAQLVSSEGAVRSEATRRLRLDSRCSFLENESHALRDELFAASASEVSERKTSARLRADADARDSVITELRARLSQMAHQCESLVEERETALTELHQAHEENRALLAAENVAKKSSNSIRRVPIKHCAPNEFASTNVSDADISDRSLQEPAILDESSSSRGRRGPTQRRSKRSSTSHQSDLRRPQPTAPWDVDESPPEQDTTQTVTPASGNISGPKHRQVSLPPPPLPPPTPAASSKVATKAQSPSHELPDHVNSAGGVPSTQQVARRPKAKEDPSVEIFQFDFSVFDFLQREVLRTPEDTESEGSASAITTPRQEAQHQPLLTALGSLRAASSPVGRSGSPPLRLGAIAAAPFNIAGNAPKSCKSAGRETAHYSPAVSDQSDQASLADDDWPRGRKVQGFR